MLEPIGLVDRVLGPVLVVASLLSWGAAFTSLGLLLATWTPRIGRAIGINLAVLLALSFGWMFVVALVILPILQRWIFVRYNLSGIETIWISQGLMGFSPMVAPISSIQALDIPYPGRWQFWYMMTYWCLLACTAAGLMYWAALRLFDRQLGRMRETSQEGRTVEPPRLVLVGAGCSDAEGS